MTWLICLHGKYLFVISQSLECQLRLRNSELEASQQQMKLAEERQQGEIENIKHALQVRYTFIKCKEHI